MNLLVPVQEVFRALSTMKVPWSLPGSAWYWPALMAFSSFLRFFSSLSSHNSGRMGGRLQLPDLEWPSVDYHGWPPFSPKYSTPPNETMVKSRGISTSLGPSYGGCSVWRGDGIIICFSIPKHEEKASQGHKTTSPHLTGCMVVIEVLLSSYRGQNTSKAIKTPGEHNKVAVNCGRSSP